jgi:hypothetical protein
VRLSVRGFLFARFIAMVAWSLLLMAGFLTYSALEPHLGSGMERWVASLATLAGSIWLGKTTQQHALHWLDPDGELRRQVREQSEVARREP